MSDNITKRVGLGTAYGFAKAGGYEGTVEEFTELLGNIAIDLARIENLSVTVTTLPAGSQATASLNGSVLSLGIPKGDKGDKGNTGDTGSPAGFGTVSATVDANIGTPSVEVTASGSDTAKNFAFAFHNLKGQKGDKGDTGEVSEAGLAEALEDFSENGTVANAEQLTTKIRANDQTPYLFRTSGGSVDIGDREYINGIVGGTVAWNQLWGIESKSVSINGITISFDSATGELTVVVPSAPSGACQLSLASVVPTAHKYLVMSDKALISGMEFYSGAINLAGSNSAPRNQAIVQIQTSATQSAIYFYVGASTAEGTYKYRLNFTDLTQMFGSTIADYIYSLEQRQAGAGVAFFKSLFPKPYYAYNSGELMSVKGLISHDMVGFNAWDEEWEVGSIDGNTGENQVYSAYFRSKNYIPVLPSTLYYINSSGVGLYVYAYDAEYNFLGYVSGQKDRIYATSSDTHYIRFVNIATNKYDPSTAPICINLSWDGLEDGNYEPYQKWTYPLDTDLELRGIPKLDASNNLYYDGDIYESDGTVTRKYGIVDLGTLAWGYTTNYGRSVFYADLSGRKVYSSPAYPNFSTPLYVADNCGSPSLLADHGNMRIAATDNSTQILITNDSYSDKTSFKTAMSGVYLVYELATPTTETADPYTNPQIVNDFGTEEFVIDDTVDVPIPVGNNTDYPIDLKAKVEMAPNSPDGDGDYIVRQTNGTNEYVALANNATIQNILSRLEALEG